MALVVLSGCSTIRNTWKDTRKLYKNYVDVDPSIDLTDEGITDKGLQKLARLFSPVDQRMEMFTRVYYTQDNPPEPEWCAQFMADFPWLSGMAVVNKDGTVRLQQPAVALRALDFAPLLELEDRLSKRKLVANATSDDMGGLIYVAAPFFENNEYAGIIVSWFEPRAIVEASPAPEELYIIQPRRSCGTEAILKRPKVWCPSGGRPFSKARSRERWQSAAHAMSGNPGFLDSFSCCI
jgi:hypothetical protein